MRYLTVNLCWLPEILEVRGLWREMWEGFRVPTRNVVGVLDANEHETIEQPTNLRVLKL